MLFWFRARLGHALDEVFFDAVLFDEVLAWLKASIRVASGNFSSFHGDHAEGIHKVFASPGVSI